MNKNKSLPEKSYERSLIQCLNKNYRLNVKYIVPAERGFYGETWRAISDYVSYFVKIVFLDFHKNNYKRSFSVIKYLNDNGIDFISKIISSVDGRLYTEFRGGVLGVFEWIEGKLACDNNTILYKNEMLSKIYTLSDYKGSIPNEDFSGKSGQLFFESLNKIDDERFVDLIEENISWIKFHNDNLCKYSEICKNDFSGFHITHGDLEKNILYSNNKYYIIDWDEPMLAPPERDAWFCLAPDVIDNFNQSMHKNGINYSIKKERLLYYNYYSFFYYLTEFFEEYNEKNNIELLIQNTNAFFKKWQESLIQNALLV